MRNIPNILLFLLFTGWSAYLTGQTLVKGIVFEDLNDNQLMDKREKGISGVAVSNGREVVLTNTRGEYALPVSQDQIIFVIKPGHYAVPENEFHQPQFYYIHKPAGSPSLQYAGTRPTGELPEQIDFPLYSLAPRDTFRMLLFGDPQPYTHEEVDYFYRGVVSEVRQISGVDLGISLGDLVGDDLDLHIPYLQAIKDIGIPWYHVMGNHDMNYDGRTDSLSDETFERNFGPATYSFNHGKVHFIVLDDILYPDPRDGAGYWGGFRQDQLTFIRNDLSVIPRDMLIVLAFHIPISEAEGGDPFRDEDRLLLFELLKEFPYTLSLSAHTHLQSQDFFGTAEGWPQSTPHHHYNVGTTCGDWYSGKPDAKGIPVSTMYDGTPKGYAFLNFSGNRYTIDYKAAGLPDDHYFSIFLPRVLEQNKETSAGIYVNFFLGSATDSVFYRIDDGPWKRMNHLVDYDPAYLALLHEWDLTDTLLDGRRPSNPEHCDHLWRGSIPTRLPEGEHFVEIRATDMFSRTYTQKSTYRIVAKK